jgi:hypothetical protein
MSGTRWAWAIWVAGLVLLILMAIPTLGFTLVLVCAWWVGGPFYVSKHGDVAPYWKPLRPCRPWWRDIR